MSRLLFLVAVAALVYLLLRSYRGRLSQNNVGKKEAEDMVQCAYCGVHLPKSEGVETDGKYYCSDAHRRMVNARQH